MAAKKAAVLDPRMAALVRQFLGDWFAGGGTQFDWYVAGATSYDTDHGTWGLTNDIGDLNTPKYQAVTAVGVRAGAGRKTLGVADPAGGGGHGLLRLDGGVRPGLRAVADRRADARLLRPRPVAGDYASPSTTRRRPPAGSRCR